MSDRPALALAGVTDPDYVRSCDAGWANETRFTWAVCEPTTGEMLAEVALEPEGDTYLAQLTGFARDGHQLALEAAKTVVRRFGEGALGYTIRD